MEMDNVSDKEDQRSVGYAYFYFNNNSLTQHKEPYHRSVI